MNEKKIEAIFPLSDLQQGILYHSLECSNNYLQQMVIQLNGVIDPIILEKSFQLILQNYDILRALIIYQKINEPMHIILQQRNAKIHCFDLTETCSDIEKQVKEIIKQDKEEEFVLSKDLLIRIKLIKTAVNEYRCLLSYHHIILDGWSATLIVEKLFEYYQKIQNNIQICPDESFPFQKYIEELQSVDKQEAIEYWKNYLSGYDFQTSFEEINQNTETYRKINFRLTQDDIDIIKWISSKNKTSYNSVFQAVIGILVNRYTNSDDTVIGMIVTNRDFANIDLHNSIGLFLNMLPVRFRMEEDTTFDEWLTAIHKNTAKSMKYSYLSLNTIQKSCMQRESFIHLFYNYDNHLKLQKQNSKMKNNVQVADVFMYDQDNYNLSITVNPNNDFEITIKFNEHYFSSDFIRSIGKHFTTILQQVYTQQSIFVRNISIANQDDRQRLLGWNKSKKNGDMETIETLIQNSVHKYANKIALYFHDQCMTYKELNECANYYAQKLYDEGIRKNDLLAIVLEKGFSLIVSILTMLKLGVVYILIDTDYPEERIQYILNDSQAAYLIKENNISLERSACQVFQPPTMTDRQTQFQVGSCHVDQDTVCIIYTSGSTGLPKGVLVSHHSLYNYFTEFIKLYSLNEQDTMLLQCSVSFDVFNQELFPALITGAALVIVNKTILLDIRKIKDVIEKRHITIISCSPRYLRMLNDADIRHVRLYISAGEALKREYYTNLITHSEVYNMYGPTEATICVTYHKCTIEETQVPIGYPINNYRIYILDKHMNMQPENVYGEIFIGGIGVSKGYLNNAKLTKKKFIKSLFEPDDLMFKTGDIGKWLDNGEIYYQNRKDRQFKLRGYRIEPGEVESIVLKYKYVEDCYVKLEESGINQSMVAFIKTQAYIDTALLKTFLTGLLPHYMIPNEFVYLSTFPINTNGKIDHDALVKPIRKTKNDVEHSLNDMQNKLLQIILDILKVSESDIGLLDNFVDMGFDSLLFIKFLDRINRDLSPKFKITDFYVYKNIEEVAGYIENTSTDHCAFTIKGIVLSAEGVLENRIDDDNIRTNHIIVPFPLLDMIRNKFERYDLSHYYLICLCLSMSLSQTLQLNEVPLHIVSSNNTATELFLNNTNYSTVNTVEDLMTSFIRQSTKTIPFSYITKSIHTGWDERIFIVCCSDNNLLQDESPFNMTFIVMEEEDGVTVQCRFDSNLILQEHVEKILTGLVSISNNIANSEETK